MWSLCGRWYFGTVRMVCKDKPHATNSFGTYYICSMRIQSFRIQKSVQWNSDASRVKYVTGADLCKHCFLSHCKFNGSAHKKCRKILMYFLCAWERTSFWTTRFPTLALVSRVLCRNRNMYNKNKKTPQRTNFCIQQTALVADVAGLICVHDYRHDSADLCRVRAY